jgi:hypothetical protein
MVAHACNPRILETEAGGFKASLGYVVRPCLKKIPENSQKRDQTLKRME